MTVKKLFLYLMSLFYVAGGANHFLDASFYVPMIPRWLPWPTFLVMISGAVEIALGILLLPVVTRKISAWLIIIMLVVFLFLIHIPMSIDYGQKNNPLFWVTIVRLPLQVVLIGWAWMYTGTPLAHH
jgi:uncharacterized membrane protein